MSPAIKIRQRCALETQARYMRILSSLQSLKMTKIKQTGQPLMYNRLMCTLWRNIKRLGFFFFFNQIYSFLSEIWKPISGVTQTLKPLEGGTLLLCNPSTRYSKRRKKQYWGILSRILKRRWTFFMSKLYNAHKTLCFFSKALTCLEKHKANSLFKEPRHEGSIVPRIKK